MVTVLQKMSCFVLQFESEDFAHLRTRPRSILRPILPNLRRLFALSAPKMTVEPSQLITTKL